MPADRVNIAITGIGAITPLGDSATHTWDAAMASTSGVRTLDAEWAEELPVRIAAQVTADLSQRIAAPKLRHLDRCEQFALLAGQEAWHDAGFGQPAGEDPSPLDPRRVGCVFGCGMGGLGTAVEQVVKRQERGSWPTPPFGVTMLMPNGPAAHVGLAVGARAGVHTVCSACASGAEAVAYGAQLIRQGDADVVVAGGTEAIVISLGIIGFASMRALSTRNHEPARASRPFDKDRDGFVMGEGAGALVLESLEHARARGARVYCELASSAITSDSHNIVHPAPEAEELSRAIDLALQRGGLSPADIVHVNAHATSTTIGDVIEARALRRSLGSATDSIAVSGTKSMTGHMIAATGAVEAIFTALALHHRVAPPTINLDDLDDNIPLDVVGQEPRRLPDGPIAALSTSMGFGGHNVALAFRTA